MRGALPLMCVVLLSWGCASAPRPPALTPLQSEGELLVHLDPLPDEARRLHFEVASINAIGSDGTHTPLKLAQSLLAQNTIRRRTLFAEGRLAPGSYVGLSITIKRASLEQSPSGAADLLVPEGPLSISAPFTVQARHATLLTLDLDGARSLPSDFSFTPAFIVRSEPALVPALLGLCSNSARHNVTVFGKRALSVSAVWPTDAEPWGVVLDERRQRVFVALSGSDELQVFDVVASTELARVRLLSGDTPRELALTPDGSALLVANEGSNSIAFIDPSALVETGRVKSIEGPRSLIVDRLGIRAFVFGARNEVGVIDLKSRAAAGTIPTTAQPLRGALDRSQRRLYVASALSPELVVFSVPGFAEERRIHVGLGTSALFSDSLTDLLYVANGDDQRISIFDANASFALDVMQTNGTVTWMVGADAENALYALSPAERRLSVFDLTSRQLIGELPVEDGARVVTVAGERR